VARSLAIAAVLLSTLTVEAGAASSYNDPFLRTLDVAEQRWAKLEPRSYTYTVTMGSAFGTTVQYRVSVRNGTCSAKRRTRDLTHYSVWRHVDSCDGATMRDLFKRIREYAASPSVEVIGYFDGEYGAVDTILTIDNDMSDESAQIEVTKFKIKER
jgi:hypothetical protein